MNKKGLITYRGTLFESTIKDLKRKLNYDKFYILYSKTDLEESVLKKYKNFQFILCSTKRDLPKNIDLILKSEKDTKIVPFFGGRDASTKYAISVYNKTFKRKINPNVFRLKNEMNKFLGDLSRKRNIKLTYKELKDLSYKEAIESVGENFILKPTNAASSLLNFKINSENNYNNIKTKLLTKYDYILEEYLSGNLYSIDFFCDGKDIFLLCFAREIPFLELIEKFSPKYLEKYKNILVEDFMHFLPIRYTIDLKKISKTELDFIKKVGKKLTDSGYLGFIHLEYKIDRKNKKIGFIEWGARTGGKRDYFIKKMHNMMVESIPFDILLNKDFSRFETRHDLYFLKYRDVDKNFVGIYTNVFKKTHVMDILRKSKSFLSVSFEEFLRDYMREKWKIKMTNIDFILRPSLGYYLYPFYRTPGTKFAYYFELDEESFNKFVKNKHSILEKLVFHDY